MKNILTARLAKFEELNQSAFLTLKFYNYSNPNFHVVQAHQNALAEMCYQTAVLIDMLNGGEFNQRQLAWLKCGVFDFNRLGVTA